MVEPRYDELFSLVQTELERSGFLGKLAAGIVLTGGSAKIEGATALAESIFHMPVRIGMPQSLRVGGMDEYLHNPVYATGIGLLMYGKQKLALTGSNSGTRNARYGEGYGEFFGKMKHWFASNF